MLKRLFSTLSPQLNKKVTIWFENVLPYQHILFDPRFFYIQHYTKQIQDSQYTAKWLLPPSILESVSDIKSEPNIKEGGLYLNLTFSNSRPEIPPSEIVHQITQHLQKTNIRSDPWFLGQPITPYLVKGNPWVEDMISRFPTRNLKIELSGAEITSQQLYNEFREYGRIRNINIVAAKDSPKYAFIQFQKIRNATTARSCSHGETVNGTKFYISYDFVDTRWHFWDWFAKNTRLGIAIIIASLIVLSYLIFDPIRVFFVENGIKNSISFKNYYQILLSWLNVNWNKLVSNFSSRKNRRDEIYLEEWSERMEDFKKLSFILHSSPEEIILVNGAPGTGKATMVSKAAEKLPYVLYIDCDKVLNDPGKHYIAAFAKQINYFPSFANFSSISSLLDSLMSIATGAKIGPGKDALSGLSSSAESDYGQMLDTLTMALTNIVRDEKAKNENEFLYPLIIIDNYLHAGVKSSVLYTALTKWAASVIESKISISSKPTQLFTLADASKKSAMEFLRSNLTDLKMEKSVLDECFDVLGGRMVDLHAFTTNVKSGQSPQQALKELVLKSVAEVVTLGFNGPRENEKFIWKSFQFWTIVKLFSKNMEIGYEDLRMSPLFKGDGSTLFSMERAGLISIVRDQGKEISVIAAKPIYRAAFLDLTNDTKLSAAMGIECCKELIKQEEAKLMPFFDEFSKMSKTLREIKDEYYLWSSNRKIKEILKIRMQFLSEQIRLSSQRLEKLSEEMSGYKEKIKLTI